MGRYILLIVFCLAQITPSFGESFSWSKNVAPSDQAKFSRGPSSLKSKLRKKILLAVDPNSFRFKDHRRKRELTILIFGDSGTGGEDQYFVANKMYDECKKENCDFAIILGDIIYPNGINKSKKGKISLTDKKSIYKKFEKPYEKFGNFDFWLTPGNHDWFGDLQHSINYTKMSTRWKMPFNHFEIPWLPRWIRMYGLDTTRIEGLDPDSGLVKEQMEMANRRYGSAKIGLVDDDEEKFCKSKGWKILFGHHGIYTSGLHGRLDSVRPIRNLNFFRKKGANRYMRKKLLPFIKSCGVQMLAAGHDHHQEHIKAIDPKTGKVVFHQILQGAAGKLRKIYKTKHPEFKTLVKSSMFGFSILTFTPKEVHVRYYGYPSGNPGAYKMYYESTIYKKDFE